MGNQDSSQYTLRYNEVSSQLEAALGNYWVPVVLTNSLPGTVSSVGVVSQTPLTGVVTLSPGTNVTLIQTGQTITINSSMTLEDLTDVMITTPSAGQLLSWNGVEWVNVNTPGPAVGPGVTYFSTDALITPAGTNSATAVKGLSVTPDTTTETVDTVVVNNNTVLAEAHLDTTPLNRVQFDSGIWLFNTWASTNSVNGVTQILRNVCRVRPEAPITVTTTGTGTSRTATASGGTPFNTTDCTASATNTAASYLQTPQGIYQITARTSDTVVTITTPSTYVNESSVALTVWLQLFGMLTGRITAITPALSNTVTQTVQQAFTCSSQDMIGNLWFGTTTATSNVTITYTHGGISHYSYMSTPFAPGTGIFVPLAGGTLTGALTETKAAVLNATTLATSGTITPDATLGPTYTIGVTGAITLNGPSSPVNGQRVIFRITNDASHSVTLATGAGNFRFGTGITAYTNSVSLEDYIGAIYNSTANRWDVVALIQGF